MHHQHHQQVVVPSLRLCQMVGGAIVISYETDFPPAFFNNCTAIMLRCTRLSFMQQATPEQDLPCKKNQPKLQSTLPRSQNSDEKKWSQNHRDYTADGSQLGTRLAVLDLDLPPTTSPDLEIWSEYIWYLCLCVFFVVFNPNSGFRPCEVNFHFHREEEKKEGLNL